MIRETEFKLISALSFLCVWIAGVAAGTFAKAEASRIVIFADFACTDNAAGDPDDCLAVEALRREDSSRILAVMAAGGNTRADRSYELGQKLFKDLTLLRGTPPRSKRLTNGHRELAQLILMAPEPVVFLVLSPATDFAKLVMHEPQVLNRAEKVVFVAGRRPGDEFRLAPGRRALRDMNYEKDRGAFAAILPLLFDTRVHTKFIGFRAGMNADVPDSFLPADFVKRAQREWRRKCRFWFGGETPPFDVVAAMAATRHNERLDCIPTGLRAGKRLELTPTRRSVFELCE